MLEVLPSEVVEALAAGRAGAAGRGRSRLRVGSGRADYPILRHWGTGFAIAARPDVVLRGYVDIRDGQRHLRTCLVVASRIEGDEMVFEFKHALPALDAEAQPAGGGTLPPGPMGAAAGPQWPAVD